MRITLFVSALSVLVLSGCYEAHGRSGEILASSDASNAAGASADGGAAPPAVAPSPSCDLGHCAGCTPEEELCHYSRVGPPSASDDVIAGALAGTWTSCDGQLVFSPSGDELSLHPGGRFEERDEAGRPLGTGAWRVASSQLTLRHADGREQTLRTWYSADHCTLELGRAGSDLWLRRGL